MNETQLSILLLGELVHVWTEISTAIEIGSDPKKISVLEIAREVLLESKDDISPEVLGLYKKVYLRDVWT